MSMTMDERKRPLEDTRAPSRSPPRKRKRPGALTTTAAKEAIEKRQREREKTHIPGSVQEISNAYYNNREEYVQTRGRTWRKEESQIKGLRGFNNWVKSCIIQKFSPRERAVREERGWGEEPVEERADDSPLLVLDMGCGKGGDLTKWKLAPERVGLYVGLDPASQSIAQANSRYLDMSQQERRQIQRHQNHFRQRRSPLFDARILVKDCFGESIGDLPIVQEVGFDTGIGPGGNAMQSRWRPGGFDVVTMMFCMHYAFETEAKARQMLKNVAGALKKGGRFIGVIPNSDILSSKVEEWYSQHKVDGNDALADNNPDAKSQVEKGPKTKKELPSANNQQNQQIHNKTTNGEASSSDKPTSPSRAPASSSNPLSSTSLTPSQQPPSSGHQPNPSNIAAPSSSSPTPYWSNPIYSIRFVSPTAPLLSYPSSSTTTTENPNPTFTSSPPSSTSAPSPRPRPRPSLTFRPPFGHKYLFYMSEAVDVPEYVVPWEAFRALAEDYSLELRWRKPFLEIWEAEMQMRDGAYGAPTGASYGYGGHGGGGGGEMREIAERMGIMERGDREGRLRISREEREAVELYVGFCFVRV